MVIHGVAVVAGTAGVDITSRRSEGDRAQLAQDVKKILYPDSTVPDYDHSYIETIIKGVRYAIGNSAKCVLDLLATLKPDAINLVMKYDEEFKLLHRSAGSCEFFHLYVSMVTNRPIAFEHERVLDMVLSKILTWKVGMKDIFPSVELLIDACNLAPLVGKDDGLPETGCRALALLASRSDLAMALVIYSIVRKSIPNIFGIEVRLTTDRSEQIEASRIRALVAEVHLAATAISGVDTTSNPVERTKAIIRAVLADRSPGTEAVVKAIEEEANFRELARWAVESVVTYAKTDQGIALEQQRSKLEWLEDIELRWPSEIRTQMDWLDAGRELRRSTRDTQKRLFILALADPRLGIVATETEKRIRSLWNLRDVSDSIFGGTKWGECLKGNCAHLKRAIRGTPFAFAFFLLVMLREDDPATIVTNLCAHAFSTPFRLTNGRKRALGGLDLEKFFYAIRTEFPEWNGGREGPSTRKLFQVVIHEVIKQRNPTAASWEKCSRAIAMTSRERFGLLRLLLRLS